MLNLCRRFLPNIAKSLTPISELLHRNIREKTDIMVNKSWRSVRDITRKFSQSHFLVHPKLNAERALFIDISNQSMRAAFQQRDNEWKLLTLFPKKLSQAAVKYNTFDRELLAIYIAIKHFRRMLKARTFIIYTDHKLLTFAFRPKPEESSF